jgi:hypothetical protein
MLGIHWLGLPRGNDMRDLIDSTVHRRAPNQETIGISRHHLAVDTEPYRETAHRLVIQIHIAKRNNVQAIRAPHATPARAHRAGAGTYTWPRRPS